MATGMFGANTDELRAVAGEFARSGVETAAIGSKTTLAVETCMWWGPDAIAYKVNFAASIAPKFVALAAHLEERALSLVTQAGDQDLCSEGSGSLIRAAWGFYRKVVKAFKTIKYGLQAGGLAVGMLGKAIGKFSDGVETLFPGVAKVTGHFTDELRAFGKTWGNTENLGKLISNVPILGKIHDTAGEIADQLELKKLSTLFEDGPLRSVIGEGGVNKVKDFLGGAGKTVGKGIGGFGVLIDGYDTYDNFSKGQYGAGAMSAAKTALGVASFVPGPVGWTAATISCGIAVYENWDTISDVASKGYDWVKGGFKSLLG